MLTSKFPDVGTNIFTTMSRLASDHGAINLGQGFPEFQPDQRLRDLVTQALNDGHNQYPLMPGYLPLRQAIAAKMHVLYDHDYDPETEVTITNGATEGLMSTILAVARPGDEVVVIEPFFDSYLPSIRLAGATPVSVTLRLPTEIDPHYRVDWQRVRNAITSKTRLLVLNFPHNPTGAVLSSIDLDSLERIVEETGVLLISDEVYEHIVFDGVSHASLASRPILAANSFVISSFGKTFHTTGWKIGYCCAPKSLTAELRKVHQFMVFTVSSPMQVALSTFLQDPAPYLELPAFYAVKRQQLTDGLNQTGFVPLPCASTFFMLADYSAISEKPEAEFASWLTRSHGVAVIPVSAFYERPDATASNHHLVRLCFAKNESTLATAIERLKAI